MRTSIVAFASCVAFLMPLAAQAQNAEPAVPLQKTSALTAPQALLCHLVYHEGTIIGRDCRTKEQWDQSRRQGQNEIREFQLHSLVGASR